MENVISNFGFVNTSIRGISICQSWKSRISIYGYLLIQKQNFIFPKKEKCRGKLISKLGFAASKGGMPIF